VRRSLGRRARPSGNGRSRRSVEIINACLNGFLPPPRHTRPRASRSVVPRHARSAPCVDHDGDAGGKFACPPEIELDYFRRWRMLRRHIRYTDTRSVIENLPRQFGVPLTGVRCRSDLRISGLDSLRSPGGLRARRWPRSRPRRLTPPSRQPSAVRHGERPALDASHTGHVQWSL